MATDFFPGFASRHDVAADTLAAVFAPLSGFSAADPGERARVKAGRSRATTSTDPHGFSPREPGGPRHFRPADPDTNPTEGWDPLDPDLAAGNDRFVDPVTAAHTAGYAEGLAAGTIAAAGDISRDRELIESLVAALAGASHFDRDRMARHLRQTVLLLVDRLVGEVGVSAERLAVRIDSAVDLLADSSESSLLRLHPDDVPLVDGKLPANVFAAGDGNIARGSFVIKSASTIVEDGPELWLEQLAAAIDRVPLPPIGEADDQSC